MKKIATLLGSLGFISIAGGASAVQYEWNFTQSPASTACSGPNANTVCHSMTFTSLTGNKSLTLSAYSTSQQNTVINGNGSERQASGILVDANIRRWDGGLGISNLQEGSSENTSPEHAIDNKDRYDVMVFEAPTANFNWASLGIGWTSNDSDVQVWVGNGNGAGTDFNALCLTSNGAGCSTGNSINNLSSLFTSLGTYNNLGTNGIANLSTNPQNGQAQDAKGRYLVVSGALNWGTESTKKFDAFKITSAMPEPQTLALLGFGLLAMVGFSRRRIPS